LGGRPPCRPILAGRSPAPFLQTGPRWRAGAWDDTEVVPPKLSEALNSAIVVENRGLEVDFAVLDCRQCAQGHGTAAAELAEEVALGGDAARGGFVMDGGKEGEGGGVGFAALNRDRALAGRGEHFGDGCDLDFLGDNRFAEPVQCGLGEDQGIEAIGFGEFFQPRVDVSPDVHDVQIGPEVEKLVFSARTAGGDGGVRWKAAPTAGVFRGEAVGGVGAG
jgi:hypothetical protein